MKYKDMLRKFARMTAEYRSTPLEEDPIFQDWRKKKKKKASKTQFSIKPQSKKDYTRCGSIKGAGGPRLLGSRKITSYTCSQRRPYQGGKISPK